MQDNAQRPQSELQLLDVRIAQQLIDDLDLGQAFQNRLVGLLLAGSFQQFAGVVLAAKENEHDELLLHVRHVGRGRVTLLVERERFFVRGAGVANLALTLARRTEA